MERSQLLVQLAECVLAVQRNHPVRVAIDGVDAAGKTTLAEDLAERLRQLDRQVIRASIDGFHRPRAERYRRGPLSPEGYYLDSFQHEAIRGMLLLPLGPGGHRRYRTAVFDHRADAATDGSPLQAAQDAILIMDGVFLLRPELAPDWDVSIFVQADFSTTLKRAVVRDVALFGSEEINQERYEQRYIPGHLLYLESERPADRADIVVVNDDFDNPTLIIRNTFSRDLR